MKQNSLKKLVSLKIPQNRFINLIHPNVSISKNVKIGYGVNICSYVNVSPNVKIGNHVNIFSQSMIGHDTILEHYSYLANNAVLGAQIKVKEGAYIGMNATIREKVQIGKWSTVGMGSVVLKNINNFETVVGNPAKRLKNEKIYFIGEVSGNHENSLEKTIKLMKGLKEIGASAVKFQTFKPSRMAPNLKIKIQL